MIRSTPQGTELKTLLGLNTFPKVYFARLIGIGAYTVYFVFFDSLNPNTTLTSVQCHAKEFPPVAAFNQAGRMTLAMIRPIEIFRGSTRGSLFIRVDISGRFSRPANYKESRGQLLAEDLTLKDFKSIASMSSLTQHYAKLRRGEMGSETKASKFINVIFNVDKDWVEFQFLSDATASDKKPMEVNPDDFSMRTNASRSYEIYLRVEKFFTWALGTLPKGQALTRKDLKDAMSTCPCKIWCNSPAFHYQGMNWMMSQVGAALHPTDIEPKFWNQSHLHGQTYFLDKETGNLMRQIDFFMNPMAAMLNKKLKAAGVL